eukprot:CAMPEP_0201564290 /NCGR_PEP_ID=MMETSP0190_2-20130828/2466_1 /ASSEMBLY_ACC=CAM_ASM_000263 /TAXON_ID=37353 /ORGANISM="Rosalina sp." /LENGTH=33 /DNA_ID= /DNA_START= /DNA_END= /DNA_ORIENTATION=
MKVKVEQQEEMKMVKMQSQQLKKNHLKQILLMN